MNAGDHTLPLETQALRTSHSSLQPALNHSHSSSVDPLPPSENGANGKADDIVSSRQRPDADENSNKSSLSSPSSSSIIPTSTANTNTTTIATATIPSVEMKHNNQDQNPPQADSNHDSNVTFEEKRDIHRSQVTLPPVNSNKSPVASIISAPQDMAAHRKPMPTGLGFNVSQPFSEQKAFASPLGSVSASASASNAATNQESRIGQLGTGLANDNAGNISGDSGGSSVSSSNQGKNPSVTEEDGRSLSSGTKPLVINTSTNSGYASNAMDVDSPDAAVNVQSNNQSMEQSLPNAQQFKKPAVSSFTLSDLKRKPPAERTGSKVPREATAKQINRSPATRVPQLGFMNQVPSTAKYSGPTSDPSTNKIENLPHVSTADYFQNPSDVEDKRNAKGGPQDTNRFEAKATFQPTNPSILNRKEQDTSGAKQQPSTKKFLPTAARSMMFNTSSSPPPRPNITGFQPSLPERSRVDETFHGSPRMYARAPSPHARPLNEGAFPRTGLRELRVEDALDYLDKVKLEFGDRPIIYNEFLCIMKDFKAGVLDTPGVIMKVSQLFRGYNHLILGFNTFLPDGFKISIKDLMQGGKYAGDSPTPVPQVLKNESMNPMQHMGVGISREPQPPQAPYVSMGGLPVGGAPPAGNMFSGMKEAPMNNQGSQIHPPQSQMVNVHQHVAQSNVQQPQPNAQEDEGSYVEFDHAITFVTKIKRRFANEPRVYQQFLEILHTYQKEQRGIKDVLEQVSALFADHPDLLKQFTYFLPEAVQEQAKERLHAAAAEAEARKMSLQQHTVEPLQESQPQNQIPKEQDMEVTMDMTVKEPELVQAPATEEKIPVSPPTVTLQYPVMPEALIYNAGVERQFFDLAKESLRSSSREGDLAWAEFLKCMDLYAQEILSKNDMLKYMEDLLGKQHIDLLEEFKRILSAAGAPGAPLHDDAWHSVPLSEIDFSRCRRCTPSYRALPRDYPAPPFSGRNDEEAKLLNDVWISLPDGSEESYTFRHMRKNQHEEVLFRCEDERFEIDMVIDSTATALNRLEPIAEEIAMLQEKEAFSGRLGNDYSEKIGLKGSKENGGIGGKMIKYSFDKSILNTIHRHAITRIYGESGQEMLDLMQKNPVVAIPVVVKRLRQKYNDFRAAREVLNRRWKELAEINYYKSIDHRSLTWRAVDKRATSTRTLAAEIKDRAANNGEESEATIVAKRDKAKEEFGSFYERTMGRFLPRKMDLTGLPKPNPSIFTPHYSMSYENNSWAQRDAYRIISFALERGSTSPSDKERCHRLWTDFLAPFFDLSSIWMHSPAAAYASLPHHHAPSIISNGDDSGNEDDESSAEDDNELLGSMMVTEEVVKDCSSGSNMATDFCLLDNQPIPSGVSVSTVFGDGTVIDYRTADKTFIVSLQCGATAFLNRKSVLCSILPVDPYNELEHPIETEEEHFGGDNDKFILGPQSLYLFFRLHQVLIKRLNIAKSLAYTVDKDQSLSTLIEQVIPDGNEHVGQKRYDAFLCLVYGLFDGVSTPGAGSSNVGEVGKYEDRLRCLLGHNAYELATMDKLVSHIIKHLQSLANDDTMQGMIQIFRKQLESGGFKPLAFRQEAALISEGENIFAFQYCHTPKSDDSVMHVELLGCIADVEDEESVTSLPESNDGPVSKKQKR